MNRKDDQYDAVVVGAGIGGLICSCYLAQRGVKTLVVEKNDKPGGCCTSFNRQGYEFDVGVHYLGSLRETGQLRQIFNEFNLDDDIHLIRNDPLEVIVTPFCRLEIRKDIKDTVEAFQLAFPRERKEVSAFFKYIFNFNIAKNGKDMLGITFNDLLCHYFKGEGVKESFKIFLGNLGVPSFRINAITGIILFKEYVLDGGYYPKGGMQQFPIVLTQVLKKFGGNIICSCEVKQIKIKNNRVIGIVLSNDEFIETKCVVSNCDARHTFFELIGSEYLPESFINAFNKLIPSPSAIVLYMGLNRKLEGKNISNIWYTANYDIDNEYEQILFGKNKYIKNSLVINIPSIKDSQLSPGREIISAITLAAYQEREYWDYNKSRIKDEFINTIARLIPEIKACVDVAEIATPNTFKRFLSSYNGAIYGWASTNEQVRTGSMPQKTVIGGLYMAGHWTSGLPNFGGIPAVALSGKNVARIILNEYKNMI